MYADSDGETHFEDVEIEFLDGTVTSSNNLGRLSEHQPTSDSFFCTYYRPFFVDYHPTPRKQWSVVLSLVWEFGASDGDGRRLGCGDMVLLDDTDSKGHTSRVIEPGNVMFVGLED